MSLTQEQIEKLSKSLSKLKINNEKIAKDLDWILNYVDLLNEVDTTWVKPTVSVIESKNILREDKIIEKNITRKELLNCSNQKIIAEQIAISNIMK